MNETQTIKNNVNNNNLLNILRSPFVSWVLASLFALFIGWLTFFNKTNYRLDSLEQYKTEDKIQKEVLQKDVSEMKSDIKSILAVMKINQK